MRRLQVPPDSVSVLQGRPLLQKVPGRHVLVKLNRFNFVAEKSCQTIGQKALAAAPRAHDAEVLH